MFLACCTRPDIAFAVSLLARHTHAPTARHWHGIQNILKYIRADTALGLHYSKGSASPLQLSIYADAGFISDITAGKSQTGILVFLGDCLISWRSFKQTMVSTSSNHAELMAVYEAIREMLFLRRIIHEITTDLQLPSSQPISIIREDNQACLKQLAAGYVHTEMTKHIAPKFFFIKESITDQARLEYISSSNNLADLLTKTLPTVAFNFLRDSLNLRSAK
jgi:ribonuclease HI